MEFFVKWKGYRSSSNTWEPYSSFHQDPETLNEYLAKADFESTKVKKDVLIYTVLINWSLKIAWFI